MARAETWRYGLFEEVSAWVRIRLQPWHGRPLAPWASKVSAVDASTLACLGRDLPWLRELARGSSDLLAGQSSALFNLRLHPGVRVQWWPNARDHGKAHFLSLVAPVAQGALLLFDRGSLSFPLFDSLTNRGIWQMSRSGNQATSQVLQVCSQADGVRDAVRLLPYWWHGKHSW
jgi:hypothetical protein